MKPMISIEYAAGFVDADGCIACSKNASGNPQWELNVVQSDDNDPDGVLMLKFQERWGGTICMIKKKKDQHSDQWRWKVQGIEAAIAIYDMFFFLVVKEKRAKEALEHFNGQTKIRRILGRLREPRP